MSPGNEETAPAANEDRSETVSHHATESGIDSTAGGDPFGDVPHSADLEKSTVSTREQDVRAEVRKLEIRNEARERVTAAGNASILSAITRPMRLDQFLEIPDEPANYRIDEVFPVGGRVMLSAQYKAGKTTAVGNLIRSLVDGDPFLGKFTVSPVNEVVLLDTELDDRMLRHWLRDQGIKQQDRVRLRSLRGSVATFNILDPKIRSAWADQLRGADLLILDVLRPVLDALGLDENRDAGRFLVAFDALLAEAGISEGVISHHMGHSGERSRGDSRLQDWPDALWKIVRSKQDDPASPRFFSAYGRDVEVSEGQLTYDVSTRSLTYAGENTGRKNSAATEAETALLRWLSANPGSSGRQIEFALTADPGIPQAAIRAAVKSLNAAGRTHSAPGPGHATLHYVTEVGSNAA